MFWKKKVQETRSISNLRIMENSCRSCSNHLVCRGKQTKLKVIPPVQMAMPEKMWITVFLAIFVIFLASEFMIVCFLLGSGSKD